MGETNTPELEKYSLKGHKTSWFTRKLIRFLSDRHMRPSKPESVRQALPKSPELKSEILALQNFQADWIKTNLNLDPRKRSVKLDNINFYPSEIFDTLPDANEDGDQNGYYSQGTWEIGIRQQASQAATLEVLAHELLEGLQGQVVHMQKRPDTGVIRVRQNLVGYINKSKRRAILLNEMVNEMMNIEILDDYRRAQGGKDYLTDINIAYSESVIFLDMFTKEAAGRLGKTAKELRFGLYRGLLTNDFNQLRFVAEAFGGSKALIDLSIWEADNGPELRTFAAPNFGLNGYDKKVNDYFTGQLVTLFENTQVKCDKAAA